MLKPSPVPSGAQLYNASVELTINIDLDPARGNSIDLQGGHRGESLAIRAQGVPRDDSRELRDEWLTAGSHGRFVLTVPPLLVKSELPAGMLVPMFERNVPAGDSKACFCHPAPPHLAMPSAEARERARREAVQLPSLRPERFAAIEIDICPR